jgi:hypothetical protein
MNQLGDYYCYSGWSADINVAAGSNPVDITLVHEGAREWKTRIWIDRVVAAEDPTFEPAAGAYQDSQLVTVTSATDGAKIRYTTDGSSPCSVYNSDYYGPYSSRSYLDDGTYPASWSSKSLPYEAPILVQESVTIHAQACSAGMVPSYVVSATYSIVSAPAR